MIGRTFTLAGVAVLGFAFAKTALAGSASVQIDRTEGSLGEPFTVSIIVAGSLDGEASLPDVPGLHTVGVQQSVSVINGAVSREQQYTVEAERAGTFTIPSLTLAVDGNKITTEPKTITIRDSAGGPSGAGNPNNRPRLPAAPSAAAADDARTADRGDDVFVERELSSIEPFVGEAISSTIRLYYRVKIVDASAEDFQAPNFRRLQAKGETRATAQVADQMYETIEMHEALIPLKAGNLELPPYVIRGRVLKAQPRRRGSGGIFEDFFGDPFFGRGQFVERAIRSLAQTLSVKPLPAGKPDHFSGLVGTFSASARLPANAIKVGDTVTLTVEIAGEGIVDTMSDLKLNLPKSVKVYPDRPTTDQNILTTGIASKRVFKFALVPTANEGGKLDLGAIPFAYFNVKTGQYVDAPIDLGSLSISGDAEPGGDPAHGGSANGAGERHEIAPTDELLPMHAQDEKLATIGPPKAAMLFASLGGFMLLTLANLFIAKAARRRAANPARYKAKGAIRSLERALAKTSDLTREESVAQGLKAFREFLGKRLGVRAVGLTANDIEQKLLAFAAPAEVVDSMRRLLAALEAQEYSGSPTTLQSQDWQQRLVALAKEIDRGCRKL